MPRRIRLTGDEKALFEKLKNTMSKAKAKEFRYEIRDYRNFIREANKKIGKDKFYNITDEQFAELFNDFSVLYTLFTPSPKVGDIQTTFSLLFEKKEDFEEVLKSYAQG